MQLQCLQVFAGNAETVQTPRVCARNLLLPCPTPSYPHLLHNFRRGHLLTKHGQSCIQQMIRSHIAAAAHQTPQEITGKGSTWSSAVLQRPQ